MYFGSPKWNADWINERELKLTLETLSRTIKHSPYGPDQVSLNHGLHFTGGEPFLRYDLLLKGVEYAKEFNIPFYITIDTAKILPKRTYPARYISVNENEILEKKITNLTAENFYFEEIPITYVHKIISDAGIFEIEEFEARFLKF